MCAVKPWLQHYDSGVPPSLQPYPDKTLLDYLAALAADHGDKPALLFKGATVSYARLAAESDAFGAALAAMGIRKGDRVDRKSTRLNSSHSQISYAVFC